VKPPHPANRSTARITAPREAVKGSVVDVAVTVDLPEQVGKRFGLLADCRLPLGKVGKRGCEQAQRGGVGPFGPQ
jgi:hypothetical protein